MLFVLGVLAVSRGEAQSSFGQKIFLLCDDLSYTYVVKATDLLQQSNRIEKVFVRVGVNARLTDPVREFSGNELSNDLTITDFVSDESLRERPFQIRITKETFNVSNSGVLTPAGITVLGEVSFILGRTYGSITHDTTWTHDRTVRGFIPESVFDQAGGIRIEKGATLTIKGNVQVDGFDNLASNVSPIRRRSLLAVLGTLKVEGDNAVTLKNLLIKDTDNRIPNAEAAEGAIFSNVAFSNVLMDLHASGNVFKNVTGSAAGNDVSLALRPFGEIDLRVTDSDFPGAPLIFFPPISSDSLVPQKVIIANNHFGAGKSSDTLIVSEVTAFLEITKNRFNSGGMLLQLTDLTGFVLAGNAAESLRQPPPSGLSTAEFDVKVTGDSTDSFDLPSRRIEDNLGIAFLDLRANQVEVRNNSLGLLSTSQRFGVRPGFLTIGGSFCTIENNTILGRTTDDDTDTSTTGIAIGISGDESTPSHNIVRENLVSGCGIGMAIVTGESNLIQLNNLIGNHHNLVLGDRNDGFPGDPVPAASNQFIDNIVSSPRSDPDNPGFAARNFGVAGACEFAFSGMQFNLPEITAGENVLGNDNRGGNFWSDYGGIDVNEDGIGDTAFILGSIGGDVYLDALPLDAGDTIFVNLSSDEPDADLDDGVADIDLDSPGLQTTFRAAIQTANVNPGRQTILFMIPQPQFIVIQPESQLPLITESVLIDATTQAFGVDLDGLGTPNADGLVIAEGAEQVIVRGLGIVRFSGDGIDIRAGGGHRIEQCRIGFSENVPDNEFTGNVENGIRIDGPGGNRIEDCIIANNDKVGVRGARGTLNNTILNTRFFDNLDIGIDWEGAGPSPNDPGDIDIATTNLLNAPSLELNLDQYREFQRLDQLKLGIETAPGRTVRIDIFNAPADSTHTHQAVELMDSVELTADETGKAGLLVDIPTDFQGRVYTAIATQVLPGGNFGPTSEITEARRPLIVNTIKDAPDAIPGDGLADSDAEASGLQTTFLSAIQTANELPGKDIILFSVDLPELQFTDDPTAPITYEVVTDSIIIDGRLINDSRPATLVGQIGTRFLPIRVHKLDFRTDDIEIYNLKSLSFSYYFVDCDNIRIENCEMRNVVGGNAIFGPSSLPPGSTQADPGNPDIPRSVLGFFGCNQVSVKDSHFDINTPVGIVTINETSQCVMENVEAIGAFEEFTVSHQIDDLEEQPTGIGVSFYIIGEDSGGAIIDQCTGALSGSSVQVENAPDCVIRDSLLGSAVILNGEGTQGTIIQGNHISAHSISVIYIIDGAGNTLVGGDRVNDQGETVSGANQIDLQELGVEIVGDSQGNTILNNNIQFIFQGFPIKLDPTRFTNAQLPIVPNDDDAAPGNENLPNRLLNHPVIHFMSQDRRSVYGTLESRPNEDFIIELQHTSLTLAEVAGAIRGSLPIGQHTVRTDSNGRVGFRITVDEPITDGVTATATDTEGNTSHFSPAFLSTVVNSLGDAPQAVEFTGFTGISLSDGTPETTLRSAIDFANNSHFFPNVRLFFQVNSEDGIVTFEPPVELSKLKASKFEPDPDNPFGARLGESHIPYIVGASIDPEAVALLEPLEEPGFFEFNNFISIILPPPQTAIFENDAEITFGPNVFVNGTRQINNLPDQDADGAVIALEEQAIGDGDFNRNGIIDINDPFVSAVRTFRLDGEEDVVLPVSIQAVNAPIKTDVSAGFIVSAGNPVGDLLDLLPPGIQLPLGVMDFLLRPAQRGGSVQLRIPQPDGVNVNCLYKFAPQSLGEDPSWFLLESDIALFDFERNEWVVTLTDGLKGDFDLSVNNLISDPLALAFDPALPPLEPPADSDGDGIPNAFEVEFFGSATGANPDADADGDGRSNLEEFIASTDPLDPFSHFQLTIRREGDDIIVSMPTFPGRTYQFFFSDGLPEMVPASTEIGGTGEVFELHDIEPDKVQFYRANVRVGP